jgi:carbonic anhydrase/acetyltransferase-like protein (isoleucine patch superfamily)
MSDIAGAGGGLHVLPYLGTAPRFAGPVLHAGPRAAVLGRAIVGRDAWFGARAVVRADGETVTIGDGFHMGARGTVHISTDEYATSIGDGVTAGPGAVIHACAVGSGCWIGAGAVILDASRIEAGAALAADAVVYPRSRLEGGWLWEGAPAKPVRRLDPDELTRMHAATRAEPDEASPAPGGGAELMFVAATARVAGRMTGAGGNGVWHGCEIDGGTIGITLGADTNIQDNSTLRAVDAPVAIGERVTIGHNVTMTDCEVGDGSLIGIGVVLAPGTRVGREVLVAAGARADPGQILEDGHLYAGRPARRLKPLDAGKRDMMAAIWPHYIDYARAFAKAQRAAAPS